MTPKISSQHRFLCLSLNSSTFAMPTLLARLGPVPVLRPPFRLDFAFLFLPNISLASSSFFFR